MTDLLLQHLYDHPSYFNNSSRRFLSRIASESPDVLADTLAISSAEASRFVAGLSVGVVDDFLRKQHAYQLHKGRRVVKRTQRKKPQQLPLTSWQMDLLDMRKYADENDDYKWILTIVDKGSRYAFAFRMKNKEASSVVFYLDRLLDTVRPRSIGSDMGREFISSQVRAVLARHSIDQTFGLPYTPGHQAYIESFNKTLKRLMFSYFTKAGGSQRWIDVLPALIDNYNRSVHSAIRRTPLLAMFNPLMETEGERARLTIPVRKLELDDRVRVHKTADPSVPLKQQALEKGVYFVRQKKYTVQWSEQVYRVASYQYAPTVNRWRYRLEGAGGRVFYEDQLQKI